MIARICGKLVEKKQQSVILENSGISYEVFLPAVTLDRVAENTAEDGHLKLLTYHYHQMEPSRSTPVLIGFLNEIEKDFFEEFITVSGIGPKAALRALNTPISQVARAIDEGDTGFLRSLPGIGAQRAKEIIAKLQGKIARFALIQDAPCKLPMEPKKNLIEEAVEILMQLQYRKNEAREMAQAALKKDPHIDSIESLLNTVYKQKVKK